MPSRRSTRLQKQETQEPVEVQQIAPVEVGRSNKKGKAHAERSVGPKKKVTNPAVGKNKPLSQAQTSSGYDALSSLSLELLYIVLDNVSK
jgi:hypothetical protein